MTSEARQMYKNSQEPEGVKLNKDNPFPYLLVFNDFGYPL